MTGPGPAAAGETGLRPTVLAAARRFKASWFELARLLAQVRASDAWTGWGFDSFEAYCTRELHLRRATAEKLVRSYRFLRSHEEPAAGDAERPPAFEVVTVLADAEDRGQLSAGEYARVREAIWDPARSPAEVRRELAERFPAPERAADPAVRLRRFAHTARRLATELKVARVPGEVRRTAEALADALEALVARK